MSQQDPLEASCAVLRDSAELINALVSADGFKTHANLQATATDAILAINRFLWELRKAHGKGADDISSQSTRNGA
jgi:hypothetical protein